MMMPKPSVAHQTPKAVALLESMVEELRCPLCFEVFHEPRTLGCMHTFCADCLASLVIPTFSPNKPGAISRTEFLKFIECPLCRRNQELGPEGVDGLPRHHAIANLAAKYRTTMATLDTTDSSLDLLRSRTPSPMPVHRPKSPASEAHFADEEKEAEDAARKEAEQAAGDDGEEKEEIQYKKPAAAGPVPTVQRLLVNHLRFRLRPDEAPTLLRTWLQSLSWVPAEFHRDVVISDFSRHFIPFYQFDAVCRSQVAWNSVFMFTDVLSSQHSLTVEAKHPVFVLASASNLHTYHVEHLVRWEDKLRHLVLSKIPVEIPLDPEMKWREQGEKLALAAAKKNAESKIPPPMSFYRMENTTVETHVESHEPRVVVYPLYYGSYTYQEKTYRVVVDAFTKEVTGDKPFGFSNRKWKHLLAK